MKKEWDKAVKILKAYGNEHKKATSLELNQWCSGFISEKNPKAIYRAYIAGFGWGEELPTALKAVEDVIRQAEELKEEQG